MYINYLSLINTKYYDITHISMIAAQKIQNIHACTIDSILKKNTHSSKFHKTKILSFLYKSFFHWTHLRHHTNFNLHHQNSSQVDHDLPYMLHR